MTFIKRVWPALFVAFVLIAGASYWWSGSQTSQSLEFSSLSENFESAKTCGPERNYLLPGIRQIHPDFLKTRPDQGSGSIPRACVNFVMNNFINGKNAPSPSYGSCVLPDGSRRGVPSRGDGEAGMFQPCVTEEYVNSVYNSLLDVSDCLNVPIKELTPKLYNESGVHVNTLGPDADGGVGQLTRSALQEVFMRYENNPGRPSTLDFFLTEMGKSSKASCQRILEQKSAYSFALPQGQRLCMIHEQDESCFRPWLVQHRCEFMDGPENPLRNVLMTAIFYRAMYKSATGVNYRAGEDIIWKSGQGTVTLEQDTEYAGYIGNRRIVERLTALGVRRANQEMIRQMLVGFGFNGGIGTGQILFDNYLKAREANNLPLTEADFDFQGIAIGSWSLFTNPISFYNMHANPVEEDAQKSIALLLNLQKVNGRPELAQKKVITLRNQLRGQLKRFESAGDTASISSFRRTNLSRTEVLRKEVLQEIMDGSYLLTLPEFMRVAHAWQIIIGRGGGAPGYLSFLGSKHKQLVKEMGEGVCTAEQYLQL